MVTINEGVGYNGKLVSLAGVEGLKDQGRQVDTPQIATVDASNPRVVLHANPRRISALIQNWGGNKIFVGFGRVPDGTSAILLGGQALQIDSNLPWCGSVIVAAEDDVNTSAVVVTEISIKL